MKNVFIVSAVRTPIGSFGGVFVDTSATQLGAIAIKEALKRSTLAPENVEEVIMGNVVSSNLGQAPARQAAIFAGLPTSTVCTTVNKVCASGMKAIAYAAQSIMLGYGDIIVAGGMENMSQVPFYIPKARFGYKYGNAELIDGLDKDGLLDVYQKKKMGEFADKTAQKFNISREAQDEFAIRSYQRAAETTQNGNFKDEITPVEITTRKGSVMITEDEEFKNVMFDKIPSLKPAFTKDGTVTAANASTINDGASALILVSEKMLKQYNLTPIARIVSFADAEQEPEWFTTAPIKAAPIALKRAGLNWNDISFVEVNEAFSVVPMAFMQSFDLSTERVNIHGGAVALGHPLGCSGARIVTTLNNILHQNKAQYGLAAICNGGGGASAMIIEAL